VKLYLIAVGIAVIIFSLAFIEPAGATFVYKVYQTDRGEGVIVFRTPSQLLKAGYPSHLRVDRYLFYTTYGLGMGDFFRDIIQDDRLYDPFLNVTVPPEKAGTWVIGKGEGGGRVREQLVVVWPKVGLVIFGALLVAVGALPSERGDRETGARYRVVGGFE